MYVIYYDVYGIFGILVMVLKTAVIVYRGFR